MHTPVAMRTLSEGHCVTGLEAYEHTTKTAAKVATRRVNAMFGRGQTVFGCTKTFLSASG